MILLEYKPPVDHRDDLARMRAVLNRAGYNATLTDMYRSWKDYSFEMATAWHDLPDDDAELLQSVLACLGVPSTVLVTI